MVLPTFSGINLGLHSTMLEALSQRNTSVNVLAPDTLDLND
jgi:hypothetical protein